MNLILLPVCAAIIYACFCRLLKTDKTVIRGIRWGFAALATSALAVAYTSVVLPSRFLDAVVALAIAILWVLVATARKWRSGPPQEYRNADD